MGQNYISEHDTIRERDAEIERLRVLVSDARDAFVRYEMDVDADAEKPARHRNLMQRFDDALEK